MQVKLSAGPLFWSTHQQRGVSQSVIDVEGKPSLCHNTLTPLLII